LGIFYSLVVPAGPTGWYHFIAYSTSLAFYKRRPIDIGYLSIFIIMPIIIIIIIIIVIVCIRADSVIGHWLLSSAR
jgi:uncharacterized membrane protein